MPTYLWTARRWNSDTLSQGQIQADSLALARTELLRQSYEIVQIQLSPEPGLEGAQKLLEIRHPEKVRPDVFRAVGSQPPGPTEGQSSRRLWEKAGLVGWAVRWQACQQGLRRYFTGQRWGHRERAVFFRQLALLLGAGVRLHRAFQVLSDNQPDPEVRQRLLAVPDEACFDEGLRKSGLLNPFELAQVEAALENSTLVNTFHRLASQVEYWHKLQQALWLQLSMPLTALVMCWIMFPVLGRLVGILLSSLAELEASPFIQRAADLLVSPWWLPLAWALPVLGLIMLKHFLQQRLKPEWMLDIPLLGRCFRAFDLSISLKIFADLYESGIRLDRALDLTRKNSRLGCWTRMKLALAHGQSLAEGLDQPGEAVLRQTLKAGEESGKLDVLCHKMQSFYEEEVQSSLRSLMALLEPAITMAVSLLVGGLCWLCLSPIIRIAQSL